MAYQYPYKDTDETSKLAVWNKGKIVPDDKDGDSLYKIGVDVWTVKYHLSIEETP